MKYNEQMLNYYPEVIKAIREFQVLIETQSVEIEALHSELSAILANAYVSTSDFNQIERWEQYLNIVPLPQGEDSDIQWLTDRRATILARLYTPEKLNSSSINEIVKIFTGGTAKSWFKDGTIYVEITPPPDNRQYKFANVEQELAKKIPAHLMFDISRDYWEWGNLFDQCKTWQDVSNSYGTWEDVLLNVVTAPPEDEGITFTMNGSEYQFPSNATWREYCADDELNFNGSVFFIIDEVVYYYGAKVLDSSNRPVDPDDEIVNGASYIGYWGSIFYLIDIDRVTHVFGLTEGMTWGEWCSSEYNTLGMSVDDYGSVKYNGEEVMEPDNGFYQSGEHQIIVDHTYYVV